LRSAVDQIRAQAAGFSDAFAFSQCCSQITLAAGDDVGIAERFFASGDYFSTLGISPAVGRFFTSADDVVGGGVKAVISYRLWRERFDGRFDVVGRPIVLDERFPATIVGVASNSAGVWPPIRPADVVGQ